MEEFKGTKGEFIYRKDYDKKYNQTIYAIDSKNGMVENLASFYTGLDGEIEAESNAKLFVAAPDLLDACVEFVRKCECGEAKSKRSYAQMKKAISKALNQ